MTICTAPRRILLVEDDAEDAFLFKRSMALYQADAAQIVHQDNPLKALDILKSEEGRCFDMIVTDYDMPEMDGLHFIRQARQIVPRGVPIYVITGSDNGDFRNEALQQGARAVFNKPHDPELYREIFASMVKAA